MTNRRAWNRRRTVVVIWLAISLVISGCGLNESIISGSTVEMVREPGAKEEITIWHTYSDVESWTFEQEYPDIKVTAVKRPYDIMK
jgi:multiple sugar transport system substrate-binding protein